MRNFWFILSVLWLWTCSGGDKASGPEEPPIVVNLTSLNGQAQKGPFNNGTAINIAELTNTLSPTGRNFSSAITDNTGRFSVANVELESPYVELRANGYYFNEVSNEISSGQLTLFALSDLTGKTSLNVNILTHLEKNRMVTLMSGDNPKTFAEAKIQAQEEVLAIFDYSRADVPESELLDISQDGAANAKLLAMSAIIQGNQNVGQMSELLANISTDIASDGTLDDTNLRNTLIENSKNLDMAEVRSNLEARFTSLGITATIPAFETEVNQFLKPPEAQDISASIAEDTQINITLAGSDPEGESLTYTIYEVNNATVTLNGDVANYTPNANFYGTDTFTYYANDGTSDSNIATVTMTVSAEDDEPNTQDVSTTTDEDVAVVVNLSAEEYDGDSYSFAIIDQPSDGSVSLNGASATYTPNQDWNGEDSFTFEATDDAGRNMNVATATITVNAINDAPVMIDTTFTFEEDNCVNGGGGDDYCLIFDPAVLTSDIDGGSSRWTMVTEPENGEAFVSGGQTTYYNSNANFYGTDYFTLTANDGELDSNVATITIIFTPVNDAPVANDVSASMDENRINGRYQPVTITLDATDVEEDDLTYSIVGSPTYGTLGSLDGTQIVYTPNQDYNGEDSFTYKANDGELDSNIASVTITVNPVNDAPVVQNQSASTNEDTVVDITLLGSDIENDTLTYSIVESNNGTISISGTTATYTPNQDWNGTDTFTYKANDGTDDSNTATVTVTVAAVNDAPVTQNVSFTTDEDSPYTDSYTAYVSDVDGDALTVTAVTSPTNGTATCNDTSTDCTYTPNQDFNGTDSFTYKVNDGELDSNISTVSITVNAQNDAPTVSTGTISTNENTAATLDLSTLATDVDGDDLTFNNTPPANGSVTIDGSILTYIPKANWNGTESFTYTASDGTVTSGQTQIVVTVAAVNDAHP